MEFREATPELETVCLKMMSDYCKMNGYHFRETERSRLYEEFIQNEKLGKCWVIWFSGKVIGYIILTFGYSFEHGGRDALVDELYLNEEFRSRGLDKLILESIEFFSIKYGAKVVYIKEDRAKASQKKDYRESGFEADNQSLFTKKIYEGK